MGNVGSVENDADIAMASDALRTSFGVDGTGVAIGVMSDSYDNLGGAATDVGTGDLPNDVTVIRDLDSGGIDEGRAMLQLVHDIAPGSDLLFHTAFGGQAVFANGITTLAAAGADVIVDDIFYFAEPFFQDGIIAQAADQAMAAGVAYYTSAGNSSDDSYESTFRDSGMTVSYMNSNNVAVVGQLHDFDPGAGVDTLQSLSIPANVTFTLTFQWDEPFSSVSAANGGATEDYDILITDGVGNVVITRSASTIGGDPVEVWQVTAGAGGFNGNFAITRTDQGAQANDNFLKYVFLRANGTTVSEFDTQSGTSIGHSNARDAIGVGAAFYQDTPAFGTSPPEKEGFSSFGNTPILFDVTGARLVTPEVRQAPDFVAPDGSNNTFFGQDVEPDGNPNFFGTSAAAPNAAAVAALLLEINPNATPAMINDALIASAIDMDDPNTPGFDVGVDAATGAGLIQADVAAGLLTLDDVLSGTSAGETINGLAGNDVIGGLGGGDTIIGGPGADTLDGGAGVDLLSYRTDTTGVSVSLFGGSAVNGDAEGDVFANFENLEGGSGNDTLSGNTTANILNGMGGSDTLNGGSGVDLLRGEAGMDTLNGGNDNDTLVGGADGDVLNGGPGNDVIDYSAETAGLNIRLFNGTAAGGGATGDSFTAVESVNGGSGND